MGELKRYDMIQACIDVIKKKKTKVNYVEIGVQTGFCLFKIKANRKLAVDPNFVIKFTKKVKAYIKNPSNFNNKFFEVTSDDFFAQQAGYLKEIGGIDVIFIDGLHLYEQVVTDVENALKHLNPGGVILLHDCNPLSESAAVRAYTSDEAAAMNLPGWANIWNGDVWKTIAQLRSTRPDLQVKVFNTDHGIGMVRPGKPDSMLPLTLEQVQALNYADLDNNRAEYLNLKIPEEFSTFVNTI